MLAPEINSARMYVGAGSAPMLAAAAAWNGLAAELRSAATAYQAVISRLTDEGWLGPASAAMAAAAAPYAAWMGTTATQAEQTAAQASAAASAYETAFAATVPPPAIAANRAQLASLVATNVLGQNAPAIAANEAQYGEMWAQDAAAMYGYAGNSAAASKVTPFSSPQPNTNPAGQLAQNAVVSQVTGTSTGTGIQNTLSQLVSALPNTLQGLASPAASNSSGSGLGNILGNLLGGLNPFAPNTNTSTLGLSGLLNFADGQTNSAMGTFMNSTFTNGFVSAGYVSPALVSPAVTSALADINSLHYGAGGFPEFMPPPLGGGSGVPALSSAVSPAHCRRGACRVSVVVQRRRRGWAERRWLAALRVPHTWAAATPAPTPATSAPATAFPAAGWTSAPDVGAGDMPGTPGMPGMPIVSSGGRGFGFAAPRYGFKPTVVAHPPAAG